MQHRIVDGSDLKLYPPRVVERLRERNLIPREARHAHVDGDATVAVDVGGEHRALGLDADARAPTLVRHERRNAARGVAARPDLAAISVPDAHEYVGLARWFERDDLVA